ncbi:MAG: glycosyltransferase family 39 protein [Anaerolineaceae bacterium]
MSFRKSFSLEIEQYRKWIIFIFFSLYLVSGIFIYRDYGIAVDDTPQKLLGEHSFNYIFHGDQTLLLTPNRDHGGAFQLTITIIYELLGLHTDQQIYYFRHLASFILFFIGTIFFFLLVKLRFKDWKIGLLGTLFLIVSPWIFESSFVNSKDIPFMALSIISLYTLFKFDEKMRIRDAIIHGTVTGYMIAIRPLGLLMVGMTGVLWMIRLVIDIKNHFEELKCYLILLGSFLVFSAIFTVLWWPWLWSNPLKNFIDAFISLSQFTTWKGEVLYIGSIYDPTQLPWHYTPVWIAVTTPLLYTYFFLIGLFYTAIRVIKQKIRLTELSNRFDLIIIGWILIPLVLVAAMHSVLYTGWRHMFFIYPAILIISISGLIWFSKTITSNFNSKIPTVILNGAVIISLVGTIIAMVIYHPYEGTYFTPLAGKNLESARYRYGLDVHGQCATEALRFVLEQSEKPKLDILPSSVIFQRAAILIPVDERIRIAWTDDFNKADYFLAIYFDRRDPFIVPESFKLVYRVARQGVDLCLVYQTRDNH